MRPLKPELLALTKDELEHSIAQEFRVCPSLLNMLIEYVRREDESIMNTLRLSSAGLSDALVERMAGMSISLHKLLKLADRPINLQGTVK